MTDLDPADHALDADTLDADTLGSGPVGTSTAATGAVGVIPRVSAAVVVAAVVAVVAALAVGNNRPLALGDPGPFVRWALPPVVAVTDLAAAITIGSLVLLATGLSPGRQAWGRAHQAALSAAVVWASGAAVVLILKGSETAGLPLGHPAFGEALRQYLTTVEVGQLQVWALGLAAVTAVLVAAVRGPTGLAWAAAVSVIALIPIGLSGHAAGPGHEIVSSAWWLHVFGAAVWVGGLITLIVVASSCARDGTLAAVVGRYSSMAAWAYAVVLFGGLAGAHPRLGGPSGLDSQYGLLVIAKAIVLAVLGVAGWQQRRRIISRLDTSPRLFVRLATGEIVVMGVAFGLAAALSQTAPPNPGELPSQPSPAEVATGLPLPPPMTPSRLLTEFTPDVLWIAICVALAVAYLALVVRLRQRGDNWPIIRTISWVLGCIVLLYITCGGIAVYGRVLFSAHMVAHMALSMVAPPFFVFGAPITLILRAVPARKDGSRGIREWLLAVMESRYMTVMTNPIMAGVLFTGSLIVFYYSGLFGLALRTHLGHELMMIHFLLAGYLFVFALVGIDPAPGRISHPLRLLLLFITMGFHAFFAVSLMAQTTLLQATYFSSLGWGIDALADQREGGAIAWGVGEGPTLLIALILVAQWSRSDDRAARRSDRNADRDHDADLVAYNAMLAKLSERDREPS